MASKPRVATSAAIAVAAVALLPAGYLILALLQTGLGPLGDTLADPGTWALVMRTLGLTVCVTITAVMLGVTLAWLTARTDLPGRRTWTVVTALPLVVPAYLAAFALLVVAGPRGILQKALATFGVEELPSIYGFTGSWLALALFSYPLVMLPVRAALRGLDPALEEAAISLGRDQRDVFWKVIMPNLRPAISSGAVLVALYALSDVGAVSLMGYDSLARSIFVVFQSSLDRTQAIHLAVVMAAVALTIVVAEAKGRSRFAYYPAHSGPRRPARVVGLGPRRWWAFGLCVLVAILTLGAPVAAIAYTLGRIIPPEEPLRLAAAQALTILKVAAVAIVVAAVVTRPAEGPRSSWIWARFLLAARRVLQVVAFTLPLGVIATWLVWGVRTGWLVWAVDAPNSFGRSAKSISQTFGASGLGTLLTLAAAWPVALLAVKKRGLLSRLVERASFVGYALPGLLVALSLTLFGARLAPALHQTLMMLALAYAILFLPQAVGALRVTLQQVSPSLEEAARSLGAGRFRIMHRVVGPLIFPGVAAGASLVFLAIMKELPATLLLSPTGFKTLATEVWTATNEGLFSRAALPALSLILLAALPLAVLLVDESRYKHTSARP